MQRDSSSSHTEASDKSIGNPKEELEKIHDKIHTKLSTNGDSHLVEEIRDTPGGDLTKITTTDIEKQSLPQPQDSELNVDGGYAWVICFACFLLNFSTWGMNSGFAIYFANYLNNNTFAGATKMDYAYIGGIAFGVGLFCSPAINFIQGKIGTRPTIIVGNCLQFTGLMLASWSRKLWQLYLTQGLIQSFGLAFISIPATTVLPQYFKKKRILSGGLSSAGSGVGGICFNLGMQHVVESKGVFWALRVQSIIGFGLTWIAISLIRSRSKAHKIQFTAFDSAVVSSAAFWILSFFVITCMFGYVIVLYTLAQFTTSMGYSEYQGSIVSAMVQLGSCCGRPIIGLLADKFGGATVSVVAYTVVGTLCLAMWVPARNYATIVAFAIIQGALMGSIYGMIAGVVARTFGLRKMNVAFSMIWTIMGAAGLFSPVIGIKLTKGNGAILDPGLYINCSIFAGVSFLACAGSLLLLRGYIKARDHLQVDQHTDSDQGDYTGINVPFKLVITSCFKTSHEKT